MKWHNGKNIFILLVFLTVLESCAQSPVYTGPEGYRFDAPEKFFLPESLTEISGISFHEGNPDSMYAVQDESGRLYYFKPGVKSVTYSLFAKDGDYEDVSVTKDMVVVLKSNGTLVSFPFAEGRASSVVAVRTWKNLIPKGEYESMYADPVTGVIYVVCKTCKEDAKQEKVSGYTLQLTGTDSIVYTGSFVINTEELEKGMNDKKKKALRPSAISKHPQTGDWYVVAAINKNLVVLDSNWQIREQHLLDPSLFRQPEGLTFDREGNLYISNEGDDLSVATVLKFGYQPKVKSTK